jgi:hypothetical protein
MRFEPVPDPTEDYSIWDQGWRLLVAGISSIMIVLIGILHLALLMEVLAWIVTYDTRAG